MIHPGSKKFFEILLAMPLKNDFSGSQALKQFVGVFTVTFRHEKFTGRDIKKGKTKLIIFAEMNPCNEIVAVVFKQLVINRVPGVTISVTPRFTIPFAIFGSSS